MMRVLVAPNAMKGSIDAFKFSEAIVIGLSKGGISDVCVQPVADGGDGSAEIIAQYLEAVFISRKVLDPLGRLVCSGFYINTNHVAIIEMASASGLRLLKTIERDALHTTSVGTGELIKEAILYGAKKILLCVGGSATVDAGMGALIALGCKFIGSREEIIKGDGNNLGNVLSIDPLPAQQLLHGVEIEIIVDVEIPLLGKYGAVNVFAPQKGASENDLKKLNRNMSLFAGALFQTSGKDVSKISGGGAAGGIAATFYALFGAQIISGADFILDLIGIKEKAILCDMIITGEGKLDEQTLFGKASGGVLKIGTEIERPVCVICGTNQLMQDNRFYKIIELIDFDISEEVAKAKAFDLIVKKAEVLANIIKEDGYTN